MKTALIIRYGAYGDLLILSPVLKALKRDGYKVIFNTNSRGKDIYENTSLIDEFIFHDEDMPYNKLQEHWKELNERYKPDYFRNFTSSIENNVATHPTQPLYIYPKGERRQYCNKNYYEETERIAGIYVDGYAPLIEFNGELEEAKKYIKKDRFNLVWALSGSGKNKVYPWTEYVMGSLIKKFSDINIITVGDMKCKILEDSNTNLPGDNFTEVSGEIAMKVSMALTKLADVVVSPDTGILHASGAFKTPKVGLLGHTTRENITKYFKNDFSIESECACAPCFRLIYDHAIQCPIDPVTHAAWCMSQGIPPEKVFDQIIKAKECNEYNT